MDVPEFGKVYKLCLIISYVKNRLLWILLIKPIFLYVTQGFYTITGEKMRARAFQWCVYICTYILSQLSLKFAYIYGITIHSSSVIFRTGTVRTLFCTIFLWNQNHPIFQWHTYMFQYDLIIQVNKIIHQTSNNKIILDLLISTPINCFLYWLKRPLYIWFAFYLSPNFGIQINYFDQIWSGSINLIEYFF